MAKNAQQDEAGKGLKANDHTCERDAGLRPFTQGAGTPSDVPPRFIISLPEHEKPIPLIRDMRRIVKLLEPSESGANEIGTS